MKLLFATLTLYCMAVTVEALELKSPDGGIVLSFSISNFGTDSGCPTYSVEYKGKPVLAPSRMGFAGANGTRLDAGFHLISTLPSKEHRETWKPLYGERSVVEDHYNEARVRLAAENGQTMTIVFRCYDAGAAFHYVLEGEGTIGLASERSEFRFLGDHMAWCTTKAQGEYRKKTISALPEGTERPLTIEAGPGRYAALGEARLVDFARMKFARDKDGAHCVVSRLDGPVTAPLPLRTPWRYIMLAESPGALLEHNDLVLNLNDPCAIEDTSWIKPGKVIREVSLTTAGGKACVDFAARLGLQYVEFDAGWYGNEYEDASDATTVTVDPKRSHGPLDLHDVIAHARDRGIGIIVYVNRRALEKQLDEILPLYKSWGIAGVKYGFVNVGSQEWTSWLHEAIRKAAAQQLMVDVHDEYRPTGYSRTYPNFMTQEGIRGDETIPSNELTLTILFTRMLAGAADNTICYYDSRVDENASRAYQLAKAVCFYSPWQFVFWYDRPNTSPDKDGGAGGQKRFIGDEPELEFFGQVPTVWDETRVLQGSIGEYAVIARRSGDAWFVGSMNAGTPRTLEVPLDFLTPGKSYQAQIYYDDAAAGTRTHVGIRSAEVESSQVHQAVLSARGGEAMRLVPQ